jgi:hypothetical protein
MKGATSNVKQLLQNHGIQPCQCLLWGWGRNHGIDGWYVARVLLAARVAHPTHQAEQAEQANTTAATPHKTSCQAVRSDSVCNTPVPFFEPQSRKYDLQKQVRKQAVCYRWSLRLVLSSPVCTPTDIHTHLLNLILHTMITDSSSDSGKVGTWRGRAGYFTVTSVTIVR